ncbi:hypothetical protein [Streptomyces xanthophaeus]
MTPPGTRPLPPRTLRDGARVRPGSPSWPVRARFRLGEVPGVTVTPARGGGPASAAAHQALVRAGLGHLGGHLRLDAYGPAPRARDLVRAARRAVAAALAARPRPGGPHPG